MTIPLASAPQVDASRQAKSRRLLPSWLLTRPAALLSIVFLGVLVLVAAFPGFFAPYDPSDQSAAALQAIGTPGHILGTDDLGRDVLSRLIHGAHTSMMACTMALAISLAIGLPLGLMGGYFGGWIDSIVMRLTDTVLSFPAIILALSITAVLGPGLTNSMIAVGIVFSPPIARLIRGQLLSVKEQLYVDAARSFGSSDWHIIFRHLIPNAIQPVIVQSSLLLAAALIAEASLSFLGMGAQPPQASWGAMLARANGFVNQAPLQMLAPGIAIAVTALAFNVLGDSIQVLLDPKLRKLQSRRKS